MVQQFFKIFIIFLALTNTAWATDYYVSTTGSNADSGAIGAPFLTIQKCVDTAIVAGDRCLINDGTYTDGFTAEDYSGSVEDTKNITNITQADPAVVTVVGHGYSNGDYVEISALTSYLTTGMVHMNNQWYTVAGVTANTFTLINNSGEAVDSTLFDAYVAGGTVARINPIEIRAINRGNVIIDESETIVSWSNSGQPANTYLSNAVIVSTPTGSDVGLWKVGSTRPLNAQSSSGAVTAEGNYYFDTATRKYLMYTTSNPTLSTYKALGDRSRVRGESYILVDGITFQYSQVPFQVGFDSAFPTPADQYLEGPTSHVHAEHIIVQYARARGINHSSASTNMSSFNTFDNITIRYVEEQVLSSIQNGHCLKFSGNHTDDFQHDSTVSNSTIHDCYYHGIQSSNAGYDIFLFGNRIYNASLRSSGFGADIRCGYSNDLAHPQACRIFDNELGGGSGGTGYGLGSGIYIQDSNENSQIYRNKIYGHNWHGIYLFYAGTGPTGPKNVFIFNNLIYDNKTAGIRGGNCHSATIENNSFYNNGESALSGTGAGLSIFNNACFGIVFKNNIVSSATSAAITTTTYYQLASDYNNLYTSAGFRVIWNGTTYTTLVSYTEAATPLSGAWDAHSVTTDPLYASPSTGDFRIPSPTTPADSTGTSLITTIPTDYTLTARQVPFDMGAYNTQGNLIVTPSVTLSSTFPNRVGTVAISFATTLLTVENDWKFVFTFPSGFLLDQGGSTATTSLSGINGTVATAVAGQVVTVTRQSDGTSISPSTMGFTLTNVRNPSDSGTTGTYAIRVDDELNVNQGVSNAITGTNITDVSPGTLSGLQINGAKISP